MKNLFAIATATVLAAAVGTSAMAANDFGHIYVSPKIEAGKPLNIDLINVSAPAQLEIYGARGQLVSTQDLNAGVTTDLRIQSTQVPGGALTAVLKVDGQTVDTQSITRK